MQSLFYVFLLQNNIDNSNVVLIHIHSCIELEGRTAGASRPPYVGLSIIVKLWFKE